MSTIDLAQEYQQLEADLERLYCQGEPIARLMRRRAIGLARLLQHAWRSTCGIRSGMVLLAVGGSGRGELHPYSDVDLLVLARNAEQIDEGLLTAFFNRLWDLGLILGQSVRTLEQSLHDARQDVVLLTNLMEARWLAGERSLLGDLRRGIAPDQMWSPAEYFKAKFAEQEQRHERYHDTAYNLEPNVKEGPGGLRDVQMITWVAMRRFGEHPIQALLSHHLLTDYEAKSLRESRDFLWRVRWGLHRLAKRAEERLLFEYQISLAAEFGYQDMSGDNRGVEQFMQNYYRHVMKLERLNERVLQQYQEEFLSHHTAEIERLDQSFQIHNQYLEVSNERVFQSDSSKILELFLWLQRRPEIKGVRASTIRLVRQSLGLIQDDYLDISEHRNLFMTILRQPRRLYNSIQRMSRYGVLGAMLPAFKAITGRMQFDLFHVYTVDQHTLFVIRNLRRIAAGRQVQDFQHAIEEWPHVDRPELLYIAALFHDIAKGRGGDHSVLGAVDVQDFCVRMRLDAQDIKLVVWLVRHHLLLSQTAQRKDITDPEVIHEFAQQVGNVRQLRYLYLLTVADISATAQRLWTSWKDSLLWDLYRSTLQVLELGNDEPMEQSVIAEDVQQDALMLLTMAGVDPDQCLKLWELLPEDLFVRFKPDLLAWCTASVFENHVPCVVIRTLETERISEVFVHAKDYDGVFATVVATLDAMRCNVLAAKIITSYDHLTWDVFQIVDANGSPLLMPDQERMIKELLVVLQHQQPPKFRQGRMPRRLREFLSPAKVKFEDADDQTLLYLECTDRPGLLSLIAEVMLEQQVRIHDARIATFGDRVEDLFVLTDHEDQALSASARSQLKSVLTQRLDEVLKEH